MPPKVKITKEKIISTSLALVQEEGDVALNARAIAKRLGCSTQPIFSNYASMEKLRYEVIKKADQVYQQYIAIGMKDPKYPPYKASGIAYIKFAKEERELFKLLFMRDRSQEEVKDDYESIAPLLQIISNNMHISKEDAYLFHMAMWVYVHGIATMIATSYLEWDINRIEQMVSDAYQGMQEVYKKRESK